MGQLFFLVGTQAFLAYLLWKTFGFIAIVLRPAVIRHGHGGESRLAALTSSKSRFRATLDTLEGLGFRVLGAFWERGPLTPRIWKVVLASRDGGTLVRVYRIRRRERVSLLSVFSGGAVVQTVLNPVIRQFESEDFVDCGLSGGSLEDLVALHAERVERFREEGHSLVKNDSPRGVCEAHSRFDTHPMRRRQIRPYTLVYASQVVVIATMLVSHLLKSWSI